MQLTIIRNDDKLPVQLNYVYSSSSALLKTTCFIEYDEADRIIKMSQENRYFSYEYDGNGNPVSRSLYARQSATSPFELSETIFYRYNAQNYLDSTIYSEFHYSRYEYDGDGNLVKEYLKDYSDPEVLSREYLAFDDKKNPFIDSNFTVFAVLTATPTYVTGLKLPWVSNHNVLNENRRLNNGTTQNRTYNFEYNELGLPIFCQETQMTYQYECK